MVNVTIFFTNSSTRTFNLSREDYQKIARRLHPKEDGEDIISFL